MQPTVRAHISTFAGWLNRQPGWRFTATLYLLRWAVVVPLAFLLSPFASSADQFQASGDPWRYLIPFLVVAPVFETLIECSLPYWVLNRWLHVELRSPWRFVFVSAMAMVLLHPLTPAVVVMAFVTGAFLAYVYFHFAPHGFATAFTHTATFHAAINLVGWTMILISSTA